VGMDLKAKLRVDARALDHAGETGGAERRAAFRGEHEGRSFPVRA
jgi:hypothetical protein